MDYYSNTGGEWSSYFHKQKEGKLKKKINIVIPNLEKKKHVKIEYEINDHKIK